MPLFVTSREHAGWLEGLVRRREPHRQWIVIAEKESLVRERCTLHRRLFAVPARASPAGTAKRWRVLSNSGCCDGREES